VAIARERQRFRLAGTAAQCNAEMDAALVRRHVRLDADAERVLALAYTRGTLSARGRHRILRVARTVADLAAHEHVRQGDVLTALGLRQRGSSDMELAA
jgi:magnesium chelatase family protein